MVPQKDLLLGVAGVFAPFFLCGVFIVSEQAAAMPKSQSATWPCLSTCAEHFCQIGPNGLGIEKETTHRLLS